MNPPAIVLKAELTPQQARDLSTFLRRATFERTLQHCAGYPSTPNEEECYRMIEALVVVEEALDKARA